MLLQMPVKDWMLENPAGIMPIEQSNAMKRKGQTWPYHK